MFTLDVIPIDLTKDVEISRFASSFKKNPGFEVLEWEEFSDVANFMEHKVWYEYMAYFKRAKEKGWL